MRRSGSSKFDVRSSRKKNAGRPATNLEHRTSNDASLVFATRWGWMGLAASARGVRTIVLAKPSRHAVERALAQRPCLRSEVRGWRRNEGGNPSCATRLRATAPFGAQVRHVLREARRQLTRYLAGRSRTLEFPIDLSGGTSFQRRVWQAARRIPYGRARSYHWIASKVGGKEYARAVGTALGANPLPLIVPCHRVVAHDGSLGGFSCGLAVKRKLLDLEGTLALLK